MAGSEYTLTIVREIKFEERPTDTTIHCPECGAEVRPCGHDQFECTRAGCLTRGPMKHAFKKRRY